MRPTRPPPPARWPTPPRTCCPMSADAASPSGPGPLRPGPLRPRGPAVRARPVPGVRRPARRGPSGLARRAAAVAGGAARGLQRGAAAPLARPDLPRARAGGDLGDLQLAARRLDPGQRAAQAHPAARPGGQGLRPRPRRAAAAAGARAGGRAARRGGRARRRGRRRPGRRLRRAAARHGDRRAARGARGRPPPAAPVVAGDRRDVRVRPHARAGGRRPAGVRRVRRVRRRAGRAGAAPRPATTWSPTSPRSRRPASGCPSASWWRRRCCCSTPATRPASTASATASWRC